MRLQRRLYGIYTVCFLIFMTPFNYRLLSFHAKSINKPFNATFIFSRNFRQIPPFMANLIQPLFSLSILYPYCRSIRLRLKIEHDLTFAWLTHEFKTWLVSRESLQQAKYLKYTIQEAVYYPPYWTYLHHWNLAKLRFHMRTEGVTSMELLLLRATEHMLVTL